MAEPTATAYLLGMPPEFAAYKIAGGLIGALLRERRLAQEQRQHRDHLPTAARAMTRRLDRCQLGGPAAWTNC